MKKKLLRLPLITAAMLISTSSIAETGAGYELVQTNGCIACHSAEPKSVEADKSALPIGPSFQEIAERFHNNERDDRYQELYRIVKHGSSPYRSKWQGKSVDWRCRQMMILSPTWI